CSPIVSTANPPAHDTQIGKRERSRRGGLVDIETKSQGHLADEHRNLVLSFDGRLERVIERRRLLGRRNVESTYVGSKYARPLRSHPSRHEHAVRVGQLKIEGGRRNGRAIPPPAQTSRPHRREGHFGSESNRRRVVPILR